MSCCARTPRDLLRSRACLAGEIPRRLRNGEYDNAKAYALTLSEIFGPDRFYLELQNHGIREQAVVNKGLLRIHEETGLPLVCTNDAHYLTKADAYAHDVLLCIQTGKTVDDENRMRYEPQNFYLQLDGGDGGAFRPTTPARSKTRGRSRRCVIWSSPSASTTCRNSRCRRATRSLTYFKKLCADGFAGRYGEGTDKQKAAAGIRGKHDRDRWAYVDYFLIVSDFVRYAKSRRHSRRPGARQRGAAAIVSILSAHHGQSSR